MKTKKETFFINNRKARFDYYIEETYEAGIVLHGSEVKSIRDSKASIVDAYCYIDDNNEVWLKGANISAHNNAMFSHNETADRKLLLKKREIKKLKRAVAIKGFTLIPLKIIVPAHGHIKVDIAICIGKHNYDKRNAIKERDFQRTQY